MDALSQRISAFIYNLLVMVDCPEIADNLQVVHAKDILAKIKNREPVEFDHKTILGDIEATYLEKDRHGMPLACYDVKITNSRITGKVHFDYVVFQGSVDFKNTVFDEVTTFIGSQFNQNANFSESRFNQNANFSESRFNQNANFSESQFKKDVYFIRSQFIVRNLTF